MKKILLMFVVLITGITNAQDTFNFKCISAEEQAIAAIYEATSPPTEFNDALNSASVIANGLSGTTFNQSRRDFIRLFDNYGLEFVTIITDVNSNFVADYDNANFDNIPFPTGNGSIGDNSAWNAWMLDIAQAIWHYGHPNYGAAERTILRKAELIALGDVHADVTVELFYSTSNGWFVTINYPNIAHSNSILEPSPRNLDEIGAYDDTKYNNFVSAIEAVIDIYTDPIEEAAAKRIDRIAQIKVLSDASANVAITDYIDPTNGDTFLINVLGDPNLQPEYSSNTYESGVLGFGYLGDTQWGNMKSDISNKIDEIDADVNKRNSRIAVLIQNSTTGVTVGARWDTVRGDLFDINNGQTTIQIYANDYDLPLVVDGYTRLENLTDGEYSTLNDAIIYQVNELDPANAIYGFTPSEFNAASLQDKVDKAFDIAKANYDSDGVSGSFVKGIIHGSKITLRVAADNYPLELRPEMAHDTDYEGWKTFIDRILYLVETGDGSLNNDRNNWIDNLQYTNIGPAITVTNPSTGHDDWGIGFDGFQFIYGGYEEVPRNDTEANKVFNKDYNGSIGELTGIAYEALLVEITRIRELVIEADGLPQADGTNLIRKNNITSYTGTAAFNKNINEEWFVINGKNIWTTTNYGSICTPAPWLGVMDDDSFRYMYLIIRNELLKRDATTSNNTVYYNNLPENECP